jgi:Domain of unknown function (DUF4055)
LHGFGALTKAVEEKTGQMMVQGARLLEPQKRAAEAAKTLRLRKSGEESPLVSMAKSVGHGLAKVLAYLVWWSEGTGDLAAIEDSVDCKLNTEFEEIIMSSDDALKLMQTWRAASGCRGRHAGAHQSPIGIGVQCRRTGSSHDAEGAGGGPL